MLPLPISPETFLREVVNPALEYLPKHLTSDKARVMLVAICLQESSFDNAKLASRWQRLNGGDKGPARGLPQFEIGGIQGVFKHGASLELLRLLCRDRDVNYDPKAIWARLEYDDVLAVACARLLLWTDPKPLPEVDDRAGAWNLYAKRLWRPGKPHPERWPGNHAKAREAVL